MYWVYFLYSIKKKNTYVGCTCNLGDRVKQHQQGFVKSTKNRRPLTLIYKEEYTSLSVARRREDYLKSLYGVRERKRIIEKCLS